MIPAVRRPQRPIPRSGGVDGRRRRRLGGGAWAQVAAGAGAPERPRGAGRWPGGRHESGGGAGDVHVAEQRGYGVGAPRTRELCWSRCVSGFAPAVVALPR